MLFSSIRLINVKTLETIDSINKKDIVLFEKYNLDFERAKFFYSI